VLLKSHSRCSKGLGAIVSACLLVNTGQGSSSRTFAAVEPSNICWNRPACVGMMIRSNSSSFAISPMRVPGSPESSIRGHSTSGNSSFRKNPASDAQRLCGPRTLRTSVFHKAHRLRTHQTWRVNDMHQGNRRTEKSCCSSHVRRHGDRRYRKIHRKHDCPYRNHSRASISVAQNRESSSSLDALKTLTNTRKSPDPPFGICPGLGVPHVRLPEF
jgi:hypothetical protein